MTMSRTRKTRANLKKHQTEDLHGGCQVCGSEMCSAKLSKIIEESIQRQTNAYIDALNDKDDTRILWERPLFKEMVHCQLYIQMTRYEYIKGEQTSIISREL